VLRRKESPLVISLSVVHPAASTLSQLLRQPWLSFETDLQPIYEARKAFAKFRLCQRSVVSLYSFEGKVCVFLCCIRTEVFLVPETVHVIRSISVLIAPPAVLSLCDPAKGIFLTSKFS
jgi:hypothetical protein